MTIDLLQFVDIVRDNFELYKTSILFQCAYLYNFIAQYKHSQETNMYDQQYIDLLDEYDNKTALEFKQWIKNVINNETNTYIQSVYLKVLNFNFVKIVNKNTDKISLAIYCSSAITIFIIIYDIIIHLVTGRCAYRKS